ncbi:hypothetical protein [Dinoroseobacter sp. S76]|uniref:hypothetical protein n=1 Tax=Dinoroseobacter sp. S76 TaxID=3415124 RepID=UPI003C7C7992
MVTACQELDQLERAGIDRMMHSLTSIKFAGGVSAQDATKLAREMDTDGETIRGVPPLTFAAWVKHEGAGTYKVTPGQLEARIAAEPEDIETLKEMCLSAYHYDPTEKTDAPSKPESEEPDFETYWDDEEESTQADKEDPPKHASKPKKDIDPDGPQNLD